MQNRPDRADYRQQHAVGPVDQCSCCKNCCRWESNPPPISGGHKKELVIPIQGRPYPRRISTHHGPPENAKRIYESSNNGLRNNILCSQKVKGHNNFQELRKTWSEFAKVCSCAKCGAQKNRYLAKLVESADRPLPQNIMEEPETFSDNHPVMDDSYPDVTDYEADKDFHPHKHRLSSANHRFVNTSNMNSQTCDVECVCMMQKQIIQK